MKFSETRRHQEDRPLTGAVEYMRRLGLIRPRDPSWCPVTRVFVGARSLCRRMFSGLSVVTCHCGGTGDRGLFAPQSSCPRFSLGAGVIRGTGSVSNAILTIRTVPDWHVDGVPSATEAAVRAVLVRSGSLGAAVQRRPRKYSEVTGALVAGRAVT